jgi:hypothetical protein
VGHEARLRAAAEPGRVDPQLHRAARGRDVGLQQPVLGQRQRGARGGERPAGSIPNAPEIRPSRSYADESCTTRSGASCIRRYVSGSVSLTAFS